MTPPPIDLGPEITGERIARYRTQCGLTQIQLAEQMGLNQGLVSAYEVGRMRLHAEMVARFAKTLGVSTDELLGLKASAHRNGHRRGEGLRVKLVRRMQMIDSLPPSQQRVLLQTIDHFVRGAARCPDGPARRAGARLGVGRTSQYPYINYPTHASRYDS